MRAYSRHRIRVAVLALAGLCFAAGWPAAAAAAPTGTPFGNFESAMGVPGGVRVTGWTIDPDTTDPIYVWITIDGAGRHADTRMSRPDVGAAFPTYGPRHGFAATFATSPGVHRVCVTASNVGTGSHQALGCRSVTVRAGAPFGNFEAGEGREGVVTVKGWTIDPDTTDPIYVWITVDGAGRHAYASGRRRDVGAAFPGYGADHGFSEAFSVPPGTHRVCVTASNVRAGSHNPLGCRTITAGFASAIRAISPDLAQRMRTSWRAGCPVPLSDLRYLTVSYRGFDNLDHQGEMVVAASVAEDVVSVFRRLYDTGSPIASMRLVDDFGGDDDASMAANNTSAFNCRAITGGSSFSRHSYGDAIDVNPVQNPYVKGSLLLPPAGTAFLHRPGAPGVIHPGDDVVRAFADIGWSWGGTWTSPIDYQHFSRTDR